MASAIGGLVRKYGAVIFFPTFTVATIYADWSHTQAWKQQVKALATRQKLIEQQ